MKAEPAGHPSQSSDFIIFSTFDEQKGPVVLNSIPTGYNDETFDFDAFSLAMNNINMLVDPVPFEFEGETFYDVIDPDDFTIQSLPSGHFAFYYHFMIYDFYGRGNIRRLALSYVSRELNKILMKHASLVREFQRIAQMLESASATRFKFDNDLYQPRLQRTRELMEDAIEQLEALGVNTGKPIPVDTLDDVETIDAVKTACSRQAPSGFLNDIVTKQSYFKALCYRTTRIASRATGLNQALLASCGDEAHPPAVQEEQFIDQTDFYNSNRVATSGSRALDNILSGPYSEANRRLASFIAVTRPRLDLHVVRAIDTALCKAFESELVFTSNTADVPSPGPVVDVSTRSDTGSSISNVSRSMSDMSGQNTPISRSRKSPSLLRRLTQSTKVITEPPVGHIRGPGRGLHHYLTLWATGRSPRVVLTLIYGIISGHPTVITGSDTDAVLLLVDALKLFVPVSTVDRTRVVVDLVGNPADLNGAKLAGADPKLMPRDAELECAVYDLDHHELYPGAVDPKDAEAFFALKPLRPLRDLILKPQRTGSDGALFKHMNDRLQAMMISIWDEPEARGAQGTGWSAAPGGVTPAGRVRSYLRTGRPTYMMVGVGVRLGEDEPLRFSKNLATAPPATPRVTRDDATDAETVAETEAGDDGVLAPKASTVIKDFDELIAQKPSLVSRRLPKLHTHE